jgi:hypothetical protein
LLLLRPVASSQKKKLRSVIMKKAAITVHLFQYILFAREVAYNDYRCGQLSCPIWLLAQEVVVAYSPFLNIFIHKRKKRYKQEAYVKVEYMTKYSSII